MPTLPLPATRLRVASLLLVTASALGVRSAFAQREDAPVPATLKVVAARECTTRADLIARVRARSPRVEFVGDAADASTVAVSAEFSTAPSGAVVGELTLGQAGAKPSARRLTARTCVEAADAAALIIAVTLDPTSAVRASQHDGTGDGEGSGKAGDAAPGSVASGAAANGAPASPEANRANDGTPAAKGSRNEPSPAPATTSGASTAYEAHFGVELAAELLVGPAPKPAGGFALRAFAGADGPPWWSPAALFGVSQAWRSGVEESGGTASFALTAATLDACPFRWRLGRAEVRPCASALGGRLRTHGAETENAASDRRRPFWVLGGAALVDVPMVWRLEFSARVAVGGNLVRDSFAFGSDVFHEVPPVTVAASLGLRLRLP